MKAFKKALISFIALAALILSGCPSPISDFSQSDSYKTSATIDVSRMVFVEEDGSETPLLSPEDGGPDEILDFVVLDDTGSSARSSSNPSNIRCVVLGNRGGRPAIWVIYRTRGMIILPNESGIEEPELLSLVSEESTPWTGDDWVYSAKALSEDGKVIIGQLSRPDGWKYDAYLGDVPAPEIGVWWTLTETDDRLYVTRARPMLLMEEPAPEDSIARFSGISRWWKSWVEYAIEWMQSHILDEAWNYMADVEGFVDSSLVDGGIPAGYYVVSGPDKEGTDSWAWLTAWNMEDVVVAPEDVNNGPNLPPWPVSGPSDRIYMTDGSAFFLTIRDDAGNILTETGPFDPNGDEVVFDAVFDSEASDPIPPEVFETIQVTISLDGEFLLSWISDGEKYDVFYNVYTDDGEFRTPPLSPIELRLY